MVPEFAEEHFWQRQGGADDFYNQWNKQQQGTEKSVNDDFDKQLAHWKDLLTSKQFHRNSSKMSR